MKRYIAIPLILALLLMLASCTAAPTEAGPPSPQVQPAPTEPIPKPLEPLSPLEPFPGKIAIITNNNKYSIEEFGYAQQVVEKYGAHKVVHKTLPGKWLDEQAYLLKTVTEIAEDLSIKALIINTTVNNALPALDKLLETRDDIFVTLIWPQDNLQDVAARANLLLGEDEAAKSPAMVEQAYKMGAKVFMIYTRRFGRPFSLSYDLIEEKCAELGMEFVCNLVPASLSDTSEADTQLFILVDVPKMIAKYGKNTAFIGATCDIQEPLIKAVVESGAIFPQPSCTSCFTGALNIQVPEVGLPDSEYIINEIARILKEHDMLGRVSTWPVPAAKLFIYASVDYSIKRINGEAPKEGLDVAVFKQCLEGYAGVECFVNAYVDMPSGYYFPIPDSYGKEYSNYLLVREGYLTIGEEQQKSN